jgi:hypothetical protein
MQFVAILAAHSTPADEKSPTKQVSYFLAVNNTPIIHNRGIHKTGIKRFKISYLKKYAVPSIAITPS